ncbi:MAG: DUF3536 domain-containing protein [Candidatus Sericytochromatia bacterium]|nr:DUF3536 domain-containing protein [Candidatus Sericytochromatia bacterium]
MGSQQPALIIHGHFYQPPRENPWTGLIDREPSAHPSANWNDRIHGECYKANAGARVFDDQGRIVRIVNNYKHLSFNFGATLMSWLERWHPETYAAILDADRESVTTHGGHGNGIAQGYNHCIMTLCNDRDRVTQVRWGIGDFRHRFGREPESLWLPETACNDVTLGTLIDEGLRYVILSPHQAQRVKDQDGGDWQDVSHGNIDPRRAYRYYHRDGSGRSIAIFFYDGNISRAVAFERALVSSNGLLDRFAVASDGPGTVAQIATDGESYGHHHRLGERCLAYALTTEADRRGFWVTNYGEFLDHYPPTWEAEIKAGPNNEGTAWSCSHGVGRWLRDCGCHTGARRGWHQQWRAPLRQALDYLRDESVKHFERLGRELFADPWVARNAYIELVVDRLASREDWLKVQAGRTLQRSEMVTALMLMEMQRDAMLMYTSCGWFFADLSGIETIQVMKYAARVLDYLDELGIPGLRKPFMTLLTKAKSNMREWGSGANIFRKAVEPVRFLPAQIAGSLAFAALAGDEAPEGETTGYRFHRQNVRLEKIGRQRVVTMRIRLENAATLQEWEFGAAAVYTGGTDFTAGVSPIEDTRRFNQQVKSFWAQAEAGGANLPALVPDVFNAETVRLTDLLPHDRYRIGQGVLFQPIQAWAAEYGQPYKELVQYIEWLKQEGHNVPPELQSVVELALWREFEDALLKQRHTSDPSPGQRAQAIAAEANRRGHRFDKVFTKQLLQGLLDEAARAAVAEPKSDEPTIAVRILSVAESLSVRLDLDRAQELLCEALQQGLVASQAIKSLAQVLNLAPALVGRVSMRSLPR